MNRHKNHKIWFNGRHWKASEFGVEMSHHTFDGIVRMIDRRVQDQVEFAKKALAEIFEEERAAL